MAGTPSSRAVNGISGSAPSRSTGTHSARSVLPPTSSRSSPPVTATSKINRSVCVCRPDSSQYIRHRITQPADLDGEPGLLGDLADHRVDRVLAVLDAAARQVPDPGQCVGR